MATLKPWRPLFRGSREILGLRKNFGSGLRLTAMTTVSLVRVFKTLGTGALLRCPRCGSGRLFDGFFHMRSDCPQCHLKFEREQGFFVGAIYINYAATVMIVIPGFFLLDYHAGLSLSHQLLLWGAFAVVFPILFFRHSRSLWLSVAYLFDPNDKADLRLVRK